MKDNIKRYLNRGYKQVEGYFSHTALNIISLLAAAQKSHNITGPVCEIGVHHGRSFILLHLLTSQEEISVAYDLFSRQDENVGVSGRGNRDIFISNLRRHHCDLDRIRIIEVNSTDLTVQNVLSHAEDQIRIFSIDGGHSAREVFHDLSLAAKTLRNGGIIVVDDYYDEKWPGVAEGVCRYMLNNDTALHPFAIFDDKMVFTNSLEAKGIYLKCLQSSQSRYIGKNEIVFNEVCLILYSSKNIIIDLLRRTPVWQSMKNTDLAKTLRKLVSRLYVKS
jgi:cephalosporin hydroxylase